MMWHDHDLSGWGWFGMTVGMIAFWALLITLVVWLVRTMTVGDRPRSSAPPPAASPTPEQLLAERFARGEIDEDEYVQRLTALRRSPRPPDPHPHGPPPT